MNVTTALRDSGGPATVTEDKDTGRGRQVSVMFRTHDFEDLKAVAEETDTPIATLVRQWTLERLRQIKPLEARRQRERRP